MANAANESGLNPSTSIETRGLTKNYGHLVALNHIDLDVNEGEIFGLMGPNGAGKTTLINVLTTLLKPTDGKARICGFDIEGQADQIRSQIGVVFQNTILEEDLTARETLDIHARIYGVSREEREKRIHELLELFHLQERKDDLVGTFSGGMKRRLEIAKGILHDPKVLFLDEPTVGLDPQSREVIWGYIEQVNHDNEMTILLTTHYLDEADRLCGRVGMIDHGQILALGTPQSLKSDLSDKEVIEVELESPNQVSLQRIRQTGLISELTADRKILRITVEGERNGRILSRIIDQLNTENIGIRRISMRENTLNDVFLHYTGHEIRD